jgi:arsenate reductase-like glutaredoxin family protein
MTKIYITKSCYLVRPLISELQRLGIEYTSLDIDQDAEAGQRLYDLTQDLTVPTLELDNGSVFVRPSLEKVRELFAPQAQEAIEREDRIEKFEPFRNLFFTKAIFILLSILGLTLFTFSAAQVARLDIPYNWFWWTMGVNILFGMVIAILQRRQNKNFWVGIFFMLHWALLGVNMGVGVSIYSINFYPFIIMRRVLFSFSLSYVIVRITKNWWCKQGFKFQLWQVWVGGLTTLGFIVMLVFSLLKNNENNVYLMALMVISITLLLAIGLFRVIDRNPTDTHIKLTATLLYPLIGLISFLVYW